MSYHHNPERKTWRGRSYRKGGKIIRHLKENMEDSVKTPNEFPEHIRNAHKYSSNHKEQIMNSEMCGCFFCVRVFLPSEITEWADKGQTAICPKCGIDSVLGNSSGIKLTHDFLEEMKGYWF